MHPAPRVAFAKDGTLSVDGRDGPLRLSWRRSTRARRLCLRSGANGIELVVPQRAPLAEAGAFAASHAGWIERQMRKTPDAALVGPGGTIPIDGENHEVVHRTEAHARGPKGERVVWCADGALHVRGDAAHLPRRLEDWLKAKARDRFAAAAAEKAQRLGARLGRVSVRDTTSRWGSCSSAGNLSFSWRLVMAPPWVQDYVIAHEIAHLRHMNHAPAFWRACERLLDAGDEPPERIVRRARAWMRRHGAALHAVRFRP